MIRKYLDWHSWLEGLYLNWIKSLTTTLLAYGGTNAIETLDIKGLHGIGLDWRQGLGVLAAVTFWELVKYLNTKPKPEEVEERIEN